MENECFGLTGESQVHENAKMHMRYAYLPPLTKEIISGLKVFKNTII